MEMLSSLRGFLNGKNVPIISADRTTTTDSQVNFNASAELLAHFHKQWEELHRNNETNANLASKTAEMIESIHSFIKAQNEHIARVNQLLASVPSLQNTIATCNNQIQQLYKSFEQVEHDLVLFEDLIEEQALDQKKNNHKQQLILYEQKKIAGLQSVRDELIQKHAQAVLDAEVKKKQAMRERQEVFQDAFKNDLETYKTFGTIPKIQVKSQPSALLEEIQLDIDDKELMDFLEEK